MNIFGIRNTVGDIRRFREILTVLFEEGLSFVVDELKMRRLVPWRKRCLSFFRRDRRGFAAFAAPLDPPAEVRLRRAFERLGPSFVKFGQILSLRPDVVPPEYCAELAKLQDRVEPLRSGVAERVVEEALGQPLENVFDSFEETPVASASLAVVHRARLKDGTEVAVKVQRPGVGAVVGKDIDILSYLARLIERGVPASRRFAPSRFVREFADWTTRELDFELEAANMDRFRAVFEGDETVVVPRVHWDFTRREVLVMDFVAGVKVDDFAGLDAAGIDRRELALVGLRCGIRQFFNAGFFHADPHPGNLIAVPPPPGEGKAPVRICLYDFGMTGTLTQKSRYELLSCFVSFVNRDVDAFAGHVLDVAEPGPAADVEGFLRAAKRSVTDVLYKPNEKKGVSLAFYRVLLAGARYDIGFPSDLVLMAKAFYTLENIGLRLYPDADFNEVLKPFLADVLRDELSPRKAMKELQVSAFDRLYFLKSLPEKARDLIERFESGELDVKLNMGELHDLKAEFDRQNDARILSLLAASLLIGSAVVMRVDERLTVVGLPVGPLAFFASVIFAAWLLVIVSRKPKV